MNMGHGAKLGRKREAAIAALLAFPSVVRAAQEIGVSESTLRRWMKLPDFKRTYDEARRSMVDEAVAVLQRLTNAAAITLGRNLTSGKPADEIRAAKVVLELSIGAAELAAIELRLAAVEEQQRGKPGVVPFQGVG